MLKHSKALVSLEAWAYNSPEIRYQGKSIDIGLLAEALIYYDQVLVNITSQDQFAEFLKWFITQGKYSDLLSLFEDETIKLYDYSFWSTAVRKEDDDIYFIMNMQDLVQEKPNTFRTKVSLS